MESTILHNPILLVADEKDITDLIEEVLRQDGFDNIMKAYDGKTAVIEAQEERARYEVLRKTGMNKKETLLSIIKQLGLVYDLPLIVGLVHTIFALLTYNRMMDSMSQETPTMRNAVLVVVIYVITYGIFYLLSVFNYYKVVWRKK